jgi:hypothetical protein
MVSYIVDVVAMGPSSALVHTENQEARVFTLHIPIVTFATYLM